MISMRHSPSFSMTLSARLPSSNQWVARCRGGRDHNGRGWQRIWVPPRLAPIRDPHPPKRQSIRLTHALRFAQAMPKLSVSSAGEKYFGKNTSHIFQHAKKYRIFASVPSAGRVNISHVSVAKVAVNIRTSPANDANHQALLISANPAPQRESSSAISAFRVPQGPQSKTATQRALKRQRTLFVHRHMM